MMGEVIQLDAWREGHRPVPAGGMISLYHVAGGRVGVDAILPTGPGFETFHLAAARGVAHSVTQANY
jgi:hypothetical protein